MQKTESARDQVREAQDDLEADERRPLLASSPPSPRPLQSPTEDGAAAAADWKPLPGFAWIEVALMANVFLFGFDITATATASTYAVVGSAFGAAESASWIPTAYLVASAAMQPLYGRASDVLGRRPCFAAASAAFALGCLGCALAPTMGVLVGMRALAGCGGAGLLTMTTIINSDLIPFRNRGMYQAMQNGFVGFGSISGAAFGGTIADTFGWRWCYFAQVLVSLSALALSVRVLRGPPGLITQPPLSSSTLSNDDNDNSDNARNNLLSLLRDRIDICGSLLLVATVSAQVLGLSLAGNELPWRSPLVLGLIVASLLLLGLFMRVEAATTTTMPVIPPRLFAGRLPVLVQTANVLSGMASQTYLFMLPLFFQAVRLESAARAGARLVIPSLAGPLGSLVAGLVMSRWGRLVPLIRVGGLFMLLGNCLAVALPMSAAESGLRDFLYTFPANFGQGIIFPSILFAFLASFDHAEHAVSSSAVYLVRSLGCIWGVSISSAILQTSLSVRLPKALAHVPNKWKVVDDIRHSVDAIRTLPPDIRIKVQHAYYDGIRYSFTASATATLLVIIAALLAGSSPLRPTH